MRIHLSYRKDYNVKTQQWGEKWDFYCDAECVFGQDNIEFIHFYPDEANVSVKVIPARIDLVQNKDVWMRTYDDVSFHPQPYASVDTWEVKSIWTNPDLQLAELVK